MVWQLQLLVEQLVNQLVDVVVAQIPGIVRAVGADTGAIKHVSIYCVLQLRSIERQRTTYPCVLGEQLPES